MTPDVLHVAQFLLGGCLYYFIVSKRFRGYLRRLWQSWNPENVRHVRMERGLPLSPGPEPPRETFPVVSGRKVESRGGKLSVDETTLAEWQANLKRNGA